MIPPFRKSNPLAMALGINESATARSSFPSPRLVTLYASELPEDVRPGDKVTLSAFVKSMDVDGNVTVSVLRVLDDQEEQADEKIWVTPPESPAP